MRRACIEQQHLLALRETGAGKWLVERESEPPTSRSVFFIVARFLFVLSYFHLSQFSRDSELV